MKRLVFLVILLTFLVTPFCVSAQTWYTANQVTVRWDDLAYPVEQGERIVYRTYLANAKTDPNKTNPAMIGDTEDITYIFTLTEKGSYFVGVRSVLQTLELDGTTWVDVAESAIGWSDDPQYALGGATFGIRFYPAPPVPTGLAPIK